MSASVHAGMPCPPGMENPPRPGRHHPPQHPPQNGEAPPDQADTTTPPEWRTPPGPGRHHPPGMENPPGPGKHHPPEPGRHHHPPGMENPPGWRPPRNGDPPEWRTPPGMETPPREADSSIRSTSGRYASYWNAFLLYNKFIEVIAPILTSKLPNLISAKKNFKAFKSLNNHRCGQFRVVDS